MKLTAFRIQNYRSIHDSGWVEIDDIAVIVGKNESGKTSLLKALWKFNPFHDEGYTLEREWPRGRRKEMAPDKVVATVRFQFTPEEMAAMEAVHPAAKGMLGTEIERSYDGHYRHRFLPNGPDPVDGIEWVVSLIETRLGTLPKPLSDHFTSQFSPQLKALMADVRANGGSKRALEKLPQLKQRLQSFVHPNHPLQQQDQQAAQALASAFDATCKEIETSTLLPVIDFIHERLPIFVYMDDYRSFCGTAQLNEVKQRKDSKRPTPDDETLIQILEMSGLDLDVEAKRGQEPDREQRRLDMNDASITLTNLIAERWTQKRYEVEFHVDGQHFITFVRDVDGKMLVPLEERSKGFQWFFSFDMMLMYETKGKFEGAIILLDEPGLHLHASAQGDLLKRMEAYASKNQLVYSTHLPFMIDFARLDRIFVAEERPKLGTKVHKDWATADVDARFTLQAALGLSWSQSLFVGRYNLVVEGVTDFWFLTTMSVLLRDAGMEGLDERLVITPVGGGTKAAYIATVLHGQKLKVAVLLDSDREGRAAYDQLVRNWIVDAKDVLFIGEVVGAKGERTLEDLFDPCFYLAEVQAAYTKELDGKHLSLPPGDQRPIVERVSDSLSAVGIDSFNKGRVAKRMMGSLPKQNLEALGKETAANFLKVVAAVNSVVGRWKQE